MFTMPMAGKECTQGVTAGTTTVMIAQDRQECITTRVFTYMRADRTEITMHPTNILQTLIPNITPKGVLCRHTHPFFMVLSSLNKGFCTRNFSKIGYNKHATYKS